VEIWTKVIVLSIGGTLGVNARYWLGVWMNRWTTPQFPWATFAINISGSFLIGFLTNALARWMPHPNLRLMVITGFLGGYTTFSTFENDALTLWERGEGILMAANVFGSVAVGFAAVVLGTALARGLAEPRIARRPAGTAEITGVEQSHRPGTERGHSIPYQPEPPAREQASQPAGTEPGQSIPYQPEAPAREQASQPAGTGRGQSIPYQPDAPARDQASQSAGSDRGQSISETPDAGNGSGANRDRHSGSP
jgi:CrcB protein